MKTFWDAGFRPGAAVLGHGAAIGGWRDYVDKYNETFYPKTEPAPAPAGQAAAAPAAPAKPQTFLGIPSAWFLYGGLAALAAGVGVVVWKKRK